MAASLEHGLEQLVQPEQRAWVGLEDRLESAIREGGRDARLERLARPGVVRKAEIAANDMLEEPGRLRLFQGGNHLPENALHCVEALGRGANVTKPVLVQDDFFQNKDGHRLRKLSALAHDAQAQRDDVRANKELHDLRVVVLDKGADNTQRREAKVLEGLRLRAGAEERVEVQHNSRVEESHPRQLVRGNTLKERKCVANAVGRRRRQHRWRQRGVNGHNLLQQDRHGSEAPPEVRGQIGVALPVLAEQQQRRLALLGDDEVEDVSCQLGGGLGDFFRLGGHHAVVAGRTPGCWKRACHERQVCLRSF
mmetsp:Transcript_306/g.1015  ORF Transcript_306/g.1015 Transcript_306/m.1015 type:complete len:309 (+) Transcript_306:263-1189(+)